MHTRATYSSWKMPASRAALAPHGVSRCNAAIASSALRRWQLWCALLHADTAGTSVAVSARSAPSAVGGDELGAAEELKCVLVEHRREAQLLSAGWATAKLQLALSACPPPSMHAASLAWAFRCWCMRASAMTRGGTPDLAIEEVRAAARDSLVEAQREVTTLTRALGCAALRSVLSCDRCADACAVERAMHTWRTAL